MAKFCCGFWFGFGVVGGDGMGWGGVAGGGGEGVRGGVNLYSFARSPAEGPY